MKMKSLLKSCGMVVLTVFVLSSTAFAYGFPHGSMHGDKGGRGDRDLTDVFQMKAHMILKNAKEIGLADDKVEAVRALKFETQKALIRQNAEIKIVSLEIREKLHASPVDVAAVNKLIDQKYELKKASEKTAVEAIAKLKSFLTQDQLDKLRDLWKDGEKGPRGEGEEQGGHPRLP